MTRWIVAHRQEGKTTALLAWLTAGRPVPSWPGWSRLVAFETAVELGRVAAAHRDVDAVLRRRGCPGGLGKVLLGPSDVAHGMRGLDLRGVEFGCEGVATAHALQLRGIHPALVTVLGSAVTPADVIAEAAVAVDAARQEWRP